MKRLTRVVSIMGAVVLSLGVLAGCGKNTGDTAASGSTDNSAAVSDAASSDAASSDAAASTDAAYDLSNVKLMSDGKLSVGCEVGYPPFEDFAEDGTTPIGYDVDIITEVARRLGLEVNIINTAWDGIFAGIDNNYDLVCSACTITAERKESMAFSTPYISNYQAVILKAGDTKEITSFNDLDGMTVAVQKETTSDELISDYKSTGTIDVEVVANEKVLSCFTQLDNGEVDAVLVDSTVADGYLAKNPDKYIYAFKDESEAEEFGIAMGLENTALKEAVDWALAGMEADGYIAETYDYWFGSAE